MKDGMRLPGSHRLALTAMIVATAWACSGGGDIQPGVGAAGIRLGDERAAVEKALGPPESQSSSGPADRESTYLIYPSKGIDVLLDQGKVRSIFLYNEGVEDHKKYGGNGPSGITLGSKRADILRVFGDPSARGLAADIDSWYRYDSGMEVTFQPDGSLHHLLITKGR
jgi:hypothetical protein